ncbi:MAG: ROK family transcriptional regulator [Candidatus Omnitrophota bacterium]
MEEITFKGEELSERARRNLAILEAIRRSGPLSKSDISKLVGLNVATVTNYIDDFLRKKIVFEKELDQSAGGRRPLLLDINPSAGISIGIGLNLMNMIGVLIDLDGRILVRVKRERQAASVKEIVALIIDIASEIIKRSKEDKSKIKGIGVGIAGIIDKNGETVRWPEKVGKTGCVYASIFLPLREILEKEFGIPAFIENDATVACFGEQWLTLDYKIQNLIYMFSGVGCGIMIDGKIYRGATGAAGEVSINNPKQDALFNCEFGKSCLLKRWESDLGLVEDARRLINQGTKSKIFEFAENNPEKITLKEIFRAVREQDKLAEELMRAAASRLGVRIAYLVNLLNPEMVIIGGGFEEAGDILFDVVRQSVNEWAFDEMAKDVKIIPSRLGENSVALGAASLVIRQIFARL